MHIYVLGKISKKLRDEINRIKIRSVYSVVTIRLFTRMYINQIIMD